MSCKTLSATLAVALGFASGQVATGAEQGAKVPPAVQAHIDAATAAADVPLSNHAAILEVRNELLFVTRHCFDLYPVAAKSAVEP